MSEMQNYIKFPPISALRNDSDVYSLAGAEFTWNYYDGYYNKDNLPATLTRTWPTQTLAEKDSNGAVHYVTRLADKYKVSGIASTHRTALTVCL